MSFKLLKIGRSALVAAAICVATAPSPSFAAPSYAVWVGGKPLRLYDRIVIRRWK